MVSRFVGVQAAEGVALDQISSRITLFNIVEAIVTQGFPAKLGRLVVVTFYELGSEPEAFEERVTFRAPRAEAAFESIAHLDLVGREPGTIPNAHRSVHAFWNLRLDEGGDYVLEVARRASPDADWETLGTRVLTVAQQSNYPLFAPAEPLGNTPGGPTPGGGGGDATSAAKSSEAR